MDFYVDGFQHHGLGAPLNYYRTREINHYDEMTSLNGSTIHVPVLFILAPQDQALPPRLSKGMERFIPQLTLTDIEGG
ncbi:Epoxide hydrolase [Penicillium lagena]|uniref:Epoxide hydrolase n=1 Tax=Penicillium lagena TaxID=94218 RepID=UPI00254085AF|nr:Epoxide hydrolase [Penicillium lagena]KAJ5620264.1 Epoxide hydrolase [Penicillium lagena]